MLKPAPSSSSAEILPVTLTSPLVGFKTPVIIFNMVDFPEPFVPIIPTHSPCLTSKLTPERTKSSRYFFFFVKPSASFKRSIGLS